MEQRYTPNDSDVQIVDNLIKTREENSGMFIKQVIAVIKTFQNFVHTEAICVRLQTREPT